MGLSWSDQGRSLSNGEGLSYREGEMEDGGDADGAPPLQKGSGMGAEKGKEGEGAGDLGGFLARS